MITLTSRAARITESLLELCGTPVPVRELSRRLCTSQRAIRYDLDLIDVWLKLRGVRLRRRPKVGVWVEGSPAKVHDALQEISSVRGGQPVVIARPEERRRVILGWTLFSTWPVSIEMLARTLGVSKRTVYDDVAHLRSELKAKGVDLISGRGQLSLQGDETACRSLMLEFLEWLDLDREDAGLDSQDAPARVSRSVLGPLLEQLRDHEAITKINTVLNTARHLFRLSLPSSVMAALSAHLLVALTRVSRGAIVRTCPEQLTRLKRRPEWAVANWIAKVLGEIMPVHLPEEEISGIAMYLAPGMADGPESPGLVGICLSQEELGWLARVIVEQASKSLGVDLMGDVELRAGLVGHLYASLEKLRAGVTSRNPLLEEVRQRFPIVHAAARSALECVSDLLGVAMPEDEAGWVTLHLGAALERLAQRKQAWRGLVVCASGQGAARMLLARLASEFPDAELSPMSAFDEQLLWEEASSRDVDLIVSTVPLKSGPVPVVVVTPFLTTRDVAKITSVLYAKCSTNEQELLRRVRANRARSVMAVPVAAEASLLEVLRPELVRLGAPASSPEEAIRIAGQLLRDNDLVNQDYVEAMIDLYKRFGAYFVLVPGVAVPHAPAEHGALRPGLSVVTLARPVWFGSVQNDPVNVVIALSCPSAPSSFALAQDVLVCLQHGAGSEVAGCSTPGEVILALRSHAVAVRASVPRSSATI